MRDARLVVGPPAGVSDVCGAAIVRKSQGMSSLVDQVLDKRVPLEQLDRSCVRWLVSHRRPYLDPIFIVGSHGGQFGVPWAALLLILRSRARGGTRIAPLRVLGVTVGTWAAAHLAKRADHRSRPCQRGDAEPLTRCPTSSSLPSDEAACAFAAAVYAAKILPNLAPHPLPRSRLYGRITRLRRRPLSNGRRRGCWTRSGNRHDPRRHRRSPARSS
jgi:hypothetical protein